MGYTMNWIHPLIIGCLLVSSQSMPRTEIPKSPTDETPVFCPHPEQRDMSNMIVEYHGSSSVFSPGDEIWISCKPGYAIRDGSDQLYCEEDGSWDGQMGRCEAVMCRVPKSLKDGEIPQLLDFESNIIPEGFEITYTCNSGFRLTGSSWNKCVSGRWKFDDPQCKGIRCYDPGTPENGLRTGNNFEIGSKVLYSCFSGYTLIGSFERYCLPNGQWSGELTRCNSKSNYCPDPGVPINGAKNGNIYDEDSSVEYRCYPGFTIVGSETRKCQRDRSWTGVEPKCLGPYDFDNNAEVVQKLKASILQSQDKTSDHQVPDIWLVLKKHDISTERQNSENYPYPAHGGFVLSVERPFLPEEELMKRMNKSTSAFPDLGSTYSPRVITYFLFDSSGSIGSDNFRMCIAFVKAMVSKMKISHGGNRIGAVSFSSTAIINFTPNEIWSNGKVQEALDGIKYLGGGTAINEAFELVLEEMMPLARDNLDSNTKSVIYIFTDGQANMGGPPQVWAQRLKDAGVEINCIGIASAQEHDLYKIASEPSKEHVFMLKSYNQMQQLIELITSDALDYSQCGSGLETMGTGQDQDGAGESIRNASQPWPWMAALYISKSIKIVPTKVKCGGSVVGPKWILTAAHCLVLPNDNNKLRDLRTVIIKLGITNVKDESTALEFAPEIFLLHPRYNPQTLDYDVALIKLEKPMEFNAYVRPVCLPPEVLPANTSLYKYNEYGFVTGWGSVEILKDEPMALSRFKAVDHLKVIALKLQSEDRCRESLRNKTHDFTESIFCAGSGSSEVDACRGDSGGPMVQSQLNEEGNIYWVQMGIVSWGAGCRLKNEYGFYSHVQRVRKWLVDTMNSN